MARKYTVVIEKDEDGWYISDVIGLPGCHTQGKTIDQLIERTKEAIKAYLESEEEPEIEQEFIGIQQVEVWFLAKLPRLTGKELGKIVEKLGFKFDHQTGSHMIYKHPDGRKTTIPSHGKEEIGPGLLNKIIKHDLKLTREEFMKYI